MDFTWIKNAWISPKISLKFVPKVRINIIQALVSVGLNELKPFGINIIYPVLLQKLFWRQLCKHFESIHQSKCILGCHVWYHEMETLSAFHDDVI